MKTNEPVGQLCLGCGSSWNDKRLAREKALNPDLISCCPDRKMVDVYTQPAKKPVSKNTFKDAFEVFAPAEVKEVWEWAWWGYTKAFGCEK